MQKKTSENFLETNIDEFNSDTRMKEQSPNQNNIKIYVDEEEEEEVEVYDENII